MRKVLVLLFVICLFSISCFGQSSQVLFSGSSSPISTGNNAATIIVDDGLDFSSSNPTIDMNTYEIEGARVSVISNFTTGDILTFTASLPSGITPYYSTARDVITFKGKSSISIYLAILRSVTFTASANSAKDRVIEFNLGLAYFNDANNHFYEYISSSKIPWNTARTEATTRNFFGISGYLTTITSEAENQFITQHLAADGWIGASDDYNETKNYLPISEQNDASKAEGKYFWITGPEAGTPISTGNQSPVPVRDENNQNRYMNWNGNEPNNSSGEHYVEFKTNGGWNDMALNGWNSVDGYIIEYGGFTGEPSIDMTHRRTVTVNPTILTTSASKQHIDQGSKVYVDPDFSLTSGGLITDARITISGNHSSGDYLSHAINRPAEISGSYFDGATGVFHFFGTAKPSVWEHLFRSITFETSSTNTSERTITFSVGNMISGGNGHFYEYINNTHYSWTAALAAAAARTYMGLQGYLATITSQAENDLIDQKLRADGWLGGTDDYAEINAALGKTEYVDQDASEGMFYWVTGPEKSKLISTGNTNPVQSNEVPYMHWYKGEPNNAGAEHYLEIYSTRSGAPGLWNDLPNNNSLGMVVEYGGLPTDPSVVLSASRILTYDEVLPVRGLRLQLKQKGGSVVLNWSVVREEKVSHYDVLHSMNGSSFRKVAEVKAKDNTGQIVYNYTDQHAVNGTNYYKIVVVDKDGKLHYSDVRSIGITGKLKLFPTMITNHFTVDQPNATVCLLTLTDASGVRLLQKTISQGINNVETGFLTSGTYFIQITRESGEPEVFKIIKK